jgi:transcriptional regulator of acetoin/glycerol metabolism
MEEGRSVITPTETQEPVFRRTDAAVAPATGPNLVVVLERHCLTAPGCRVALDQLDEVVVARSSESAVARAGRAATLHVSDFKTSRRHLVIRRTQAGWFAEDLGSRNGTLYNGRRVERVMLGNGDLLEAGGAMLRFLTDGAPSGTPAVASAFPRTLNHTLESRFLQAQKIAPSGVPVLVRGETGTGKELLARAVHAVSGRPGPFVAVNCGALPRDLIESELFGHRRGAFSGATEDRDGLVRRAHRGTLFLDEIAELPIDSQAALLRVLQDGEVRAVGASEDIKVDVRVIAATHQDLAVRIADGRFRQDLYGRIAGFELMLPALRDRSEDLGVLIADLLPRICPQPEQLVMNRTAALALMHHRWPQNIRELEQALRSAVALCDDHEIRVEHLPEVIGGWQPPGAPMLDSEDRALRDKLIDLLRQTGGNVAAVAREMDRAPLQIRRWCRRLHIDVDQFRT